MFVLNSLPESVFSIGDGLHLVLIADWHGQFTPEFVARDLREAGNPLFSVQCL